MPLLLQELVATPAENAAVDGVTAAVSIAVVVAAAVNVAAASTVVAAAVVVLTAYAAVASAVVVAAASVAVVVAVVVVDDDDGGALGAAAVAHINDADAHSTAHTYTEKPRITFSISCMVEGVLLQLSLRLPQVFLV